MFKIIYRGTSKSILIKPKTIINAMPKETTTIIVMLDIWLLVIASISWARISSPGSAKEIKKPSIKPEATTIQSLFFLVMLWPRTDPRGVMPKSTPIKKKVRPNTINAAPTINITSRLVPRGTNVKFSRMTRITTGITAISVSFSFSVKIFK